MSDISCHREPIVPFHPMIMFLVSVAADYSPSNTHAYLRYVLKRTFAILSSAVTAARGSAARARGTLY